MIHLGFKDNVHGWLFLKQAKWTLAVGTKATFDESTFPLNDGYNKNEKPFPHPQEIRYEDESVVWDFLLDLPEDHNTPHANDHHPYEADEGSISKEVASSPDEPEEIDVSQDETESDSHDDDLSNNDDQSGSRQEESDTSESQDESESSSSEQEVQEQPLRQSTRVRVPVRRPDNVYGDTAPSQILRGRDTLSRQLREPSIVPQPAAPGNRGGNLDQTNWDDIFGDSNMALMAKQGGVQMVNLLLANAVTDSPQNRPDYRSWTYKTLQHLPSEEQHIWKQACFDELEALIKRQVFTMSKLPKGCKPIKCHWVFDEKSDGRKRARLVAKGFSQIDGIDYNEIFSPVVRYEPVCFMLALAALKNWHMTAVDVKTAFLYGKLDEEIYMEQPEGFQIKGSEKKVLRLQRAIYGLKQAALSWWKELCTSMRSMGLTPLSSDAGIFIHKKKQVYVIVYVDDCVFMGQNKAFVNEIKSVFIKKWECRDLGDVKEFLRMRITKKGHDIYLDQCAYLKKILEKFNMTNAKRASTPLPADYVPEVYNSKIDTGRRQLYQQVIGSLLYLMLGTRPDIAYAVTKMSQYAANPSKEHLDKALYIFRYLAATQDYYLYYHGKNGEGFIAYSDSDWASDKSTRRSTTGYILKLAGCVFSWNSKAQKTIALSSTEAEYMALSDCSRQCVWIKTLLSELQIPIKYFPICADNQGSIFIGQNPVQERCTKHIDVRYHFIRQCVEDKKVKLFFVAGTKNPADMFTKILSKTKFLHCLEGLGLIIRKQETPADKIVARKH